jgi:hypothetical protein
MWLLWLILDHGDGVLKGIEGKAETSWKIKTISLT